MPKIEFKKSLKQIEDSISQGSPPLSSQSTKLLNDVCNKLCEDVGKANSDAVNTKDVIKSICKTIPKGILAGVEADTNSSFSQMKGPVKFNYHRTGPILTRPKGLLSQQQHHQQSASIISDQTSSDKDDYEVQFLGLEPLHQAIKDELQSNFDCLVTTLHVLLVNRGLRCIGVGEEFFPETEGKEDGVKGSELLPKKWNDVQNVYSLKYVRSNAMYLMKVIKIENSALLVNLVNINKGQFAGFLIDDVKKYVSENYKDFLGNYMNLDSLRRLFRNEIEAKVNIDSLVDTEKGCDRNMEFKGLELLHQAIKEELKNKFDCLVTALHVLLLNKGLRCVGVCDQVIPETDGDHDGVKASELLPEKWNDLQDFYNLKYASTSNVIYLMKVIKTGNSALLVNLVNVNKGQFAGFLIDDVKKYVSENYKEFFGNYANLGSLHQLFRSEIESKVEIGSRFYESEIINRMAAMGRSDIKESPPIEQNTALLSPIGSRDLQESIETVPFALNMPWIQKEDPSSFVNPLGSRDLDPLGNLTGGTGGGMLMDPSLIRDPAEFCAPRGGEGQGIPRGAVPPGSRFNPVAPVFPGRSDLMVPDTDHLQPPP